MKIMRLPLAICATALLASPVLAQTTAPTTTPQAQTTAPKPATPAVTAPSGSASTANQGAVTFKNQQMQNELSVSRLAGTTVRNTNGDDLGDINDIILDPQTKAATVIIGVGGFLGLGEKNIGVPMEQLQLTMGNDGNRVAQLNVTKEALQAAPQYVMLDRSGSTTGVTTTPRTQ